MSKTMELDAAGAPSGCPALREKDLCLYFRYLRDVAQSGELSVDCYETFVYLLDTLTTKERISAYWPILAALWPDRLAEYSPERFPTLFVYSTINVRVDLSVRMRRAAEALSGDTDSDTGCGCFGGCSTRVPERHAEGVYE